MTSNISLECKCKNQKNMCFNLFGYTSQLSNKFEKYVPKNKKSCTMERILPRATLFLLVT